MSEQWYVSAPDEGIEVYDSEQEARDMAESILAHHREASHEGWHDDMAALHWGRLVPSQVATKINEREAPPGSEFDTLCEYVLKAVPS